MARAVGIQSLLPANQELLLRAALEQAPEAIVIADPFTGQFVYANEASVRMFASSLEEVLAHGPLHFSPPLQPDGRESAVAAREYLAEAVSKGSCRFEWKHRSCDGVEFICEVRLTALETSGRRYVRGSIFDIDQRKQMEHRLHEGNRRLRIMNRSAHGITTGDSVQELVQLAVRLLHEAYSEFRGVYATINADGVLHVLCSVEPGGMPTLTGKEVDLSSVAPAYLEALRSHATLAVSDVRENPVTLPMQKMLREEVGAAAILDVPLRHVDGLEGILCLDSPRPHSWTPDERATVESVARFLSVAVRDAHIWNERMRAEVALQSLNSTLKDRVRREVEKNREKDVIMFHQSRHAAMGEMISNIAHQWRQPLNALGMVLFNIHDAYAHNDLSAETLEEDVNKAGRLIKQMSSTISDFRNFFRPDRVRTVFCPATIVQEAVSLVQPDLQYHNILIHSIGMHQTQICGFANEYSQVVLNLLKNARDAILEQGAQGELYITLDREGPDAVLRIRDNGHGFSPETLPRIFEPYFSTREEGKGTGIGLYMSRLIIEEHMGGRIEARNVAGGAEMVVRVPCAPDDCLTE